MAMFTYVYFLLQCKETFAHLLHVTSRDIHTFHQLGNRLITQIKNLFLCLLKCKIFLYAIINFVAHNVYILLEFLSKLCKLVIFFSVVNVIVSNENTFVEKSGYSISVAHMYSTVR